jgi:hypothetical protein
LKIHAVKGEIMQYVNMTTVESQLTGVLEERLKYSRVGSTTGAKEIQLINVRAISNSHPNAKEVETSTKRLR